MVKRKKKSDFEIDLNGDDVNIEFGPIKIKGSKGPTQEEVKLRSKLEIVLSNYEKMKSIYREKIIRQQERLNAYRQIIRVLLPKLENIKNTSLNDKEKEEIQKIQDWVKDLTKDDKL